MQLDPSVGEGVTTAATGADTQTMKTNLTWNRDADRDEYESDDWHWQVKPAGTPGLYDVRDLIDREWIAFDLTLAKAKALCEDRHADDLANFGKRLGLL